MENNLISIAKDNSIRISPLKIGSIVRLIVNLKVSKAVNQLKFSQKMLQ